MLLGTPEAIAGTESLLLPDEMRNPRRSRWYCDRLRPGSRSGPLQKIRGIA
jgi:hypothetical protein